MAPYRQLEQMGELGSKQFSLVAGCGGWIRVAFALLLALSLSGCILGSERPATYIQESRQSRGAPDAALPAVDWWRGFRSRELTTLMQAAQIYNLDIAVAIAQIVQADAQVGISGAALLPSVTGTAMAERLHQAGANSSQFNVNLTASYMVDFWGKNRALLYSAEENATVA